MTYDANTPNAGQSPGVFPTGNNTNFTRLKTIINADHVFNDVAQADDGAHRKMSMVDVSVVPSSLAAGVNGIIYSKVFGTASQLYYYNGGAIQAVTPIRAAVNFNGTGAVGAQTIRSSYNVSSVVKTATGKYTINFTTAIPNNNYIVQLTGMRNTSNDISNGLVEGNATYGNSVSTTSLKIQFNGGSSNLQDVLMGNVIIMSMP